MSQPSVNKAAVLSLKKRWQFERVYGAGKSFASKHLVLYVLENDAGQVRVGYSVGKRLGKAVVRNRIRRLLKECFRVLAGSIKCPGVDIVWIARRFIVSSNFNEIKEAMEQLMKKAGLI